MGIILSLPISYSSTVRGDTNAHLRADIHTILSALMPFVAITDGFAYTLTTPNGLTAILRVWNPSLGGAAGVVSFQMTDITNTRVGFEHWIDTGSGHTYRLAACPSQIFLAASGVVRRVDVGNSVAMGIPYVADVSPSSGCVEGIGPGTTTECWWSCGDGGSNANHFRWTYFSGDAWSACYNGDLINSALTPYSETGRLRLIPPAIAQRLDSPSVSVRALFRGSNTPLYADPLIAWGSSLNPLSIAKVRGQLFNSTMPTMDNALDATITVDLTDFVNYMHDDTVNAESWWTSLLLLKATPTPPTTGGLGNYVY